MRELVQAWHPQGIPRDGGTLNRSPWPLLTKLGEKDDVEAYLEAFKRTAEAAQWPKDQWVFFLGPYLSGEALLAIKALEKPGIANYAALKRAILDHYSISPETYRQWLRAPCLPEGVRPRAVVAGLKDAATRWLRPPLRTGSGSQS